MKRFIRVIAVILILAAVFTLMSSVVFAATSKSGTNLSVTVKTGKRPWYSPRNATVTIKNTGSSAMTINVEDSNGRLYKRVTSLSAGKSITI